MTHDGPFAAAPEGVHDDYQTKIRVKATPDEIFDAVTTTAGLSAWWVPRVTGSGAEGGDLQFQMSSPDPLVVHVDQAVRPRVVQWTISECTFESDWVGTRPNFTIIAIDGEFSELTFEHRGLTPALECNEYCRRSWNHFIEKSLRDYLESGEGSPRGSKADEAWRAALATQK